MAKSIYITSIFLLLIVSSYAQNKVGAFGETLPKQSVPIPEISTVSKENINQGANNVADKTKGKKTDEKKANDSQYRYMSYKIQVTVTDTPLDLNHHIFELYKDITFNQTKSNGFTYFQGDYSNEEQAKVVLMKIQRIFPQAIMVKERRYLKTN